jgi:GT2 family glycosyltransferase
MGAKPFLMRVELSIIFVNWNSLEYLRGCLVSLFEQTHGVSFEIIVIDNNSSEAGVEKLKQQFPEISIVMSEVNLGFAGANNLGFRKSSGSYVLFLNPDTQMTGPAIQVMLQKLKTLPRAGIVGCKLLNTDLSIQTSCIQTFPTISNQLLDIESLRLRWPSCPMWNIAPLYATETEPTPVEVISGACMIMKREVFERAGMFSEEYFMYAEDLDLCYKIIRLGLKNYYVGEAEIIHHGGKSSGQARVSQWSTIMKLRAVHKFCTKTRGRVYGSLYKAAMGCAATGRLMLIALLRLFGNAAVQNNSLRPAEDKWRAVLKWAIGANSLKLGTTSNR